MKMDISYEVMDTRNPKPVILGPVGVLQHTPGGMNILTNAVTSMFIDLREDDDDNSLMADREAEGIVTFDLPDGMIILTRLTLENYRERVYPYINGNPGPFPSDDAVNQHFFKYITEKA